MGCALAAIVGLPLMTLLSMAATLSGASTLEWSAWIVGAGALAAIVGAGYANSNKRVSSLFSQEQRSTLIYWLVECPLSTRSGHLTRLVSLDAFPGRPTNEHIRLEGIFASLSGRPA